jgi:hypothetical protein
MRFVLLLSILLLSAPDLSAADAPVGRPLFELGILVGGGPWDVTKSRQFAPDHMAETATAAPRSRVHSMRSRVHRLPISGIPISGITVTNTATTAKSAPAADGGATAPKFDYDIEVTCVYRSARLRIEKTETAKAGKPCPSVDPTDSVYISSLTMRLIGNEKGSYSIEYHCRIFTDPNQPEMDGQQWQECDASNGPKRKGITAVTVAIKARTPTFDLNILSDGNKYQWPSKETTTGDWIKILMPENTKITALSVKKTANPTTDDPPHFDFDIDAMCTYAPVTTGASAPTALCSISPPASASYLQGLDLQLTGNESNSYQINYRCWTSGIDGKMNQLPANGGLYGIPGVSDGGCRAASGQWMRGVEIRVDQRQPSFQLGYVAGRNAMKYVTATPAGDNGDGALALIPDGASFGRISLANLSSSDYGFDVTCTYDLNGKDTTDQKKNPCPGILPAEPYRMKSVSLALTGKEKDKYSIAYRCWISELQDSQIIIRAPTDAADKPCGPAPAGKQQWISGIQVFVKTKAAGN